MKKLLVASTLLLAAACAQSQTYVEVGWLRVKAKESVSNNDWSATPSAARGILGYELDPNLAIEGLAALGVNRATVSTADTDQLKIESIFGAYLKPKFKLNDRLEVFGRLGYARLKGVGYSEGYAPAPETDSRMSYGAGLSYAIKENTFLSVDYMHYLKKEQLRYTGFSVGLGYRF